MVDENPHFPIRGGCPEPEAIAAYVDGRLSGPDKADIETHLASCDDCFTVFSETARSEAELGKADAAAAVVRPRFGRRWIVLAAAAALVAAAIPLATFLRARRRVPPDVAELVAAVGAERPFEPRLTGGFAYGPMAPRYRSAKPLSESESWEVLAAAAKIRQRDDQHSTPATLDALGAANLVLGKYDDAVSNLEEATLEAPKNARYLTDLSAAYLVRAGEKDRADDYPKALEAAQKATELDPSILEAWFNRALALDELPLKSEAAKAWRDYLARDSRSGWADEARRRLAAIEAIPNHAEEWKKAKARLLAAATAGDAKAIRAIVPDYCQETREMVEEKLLPAWAEAESSGNKDLADRQQFAATRLAVEQSKSSGDRILLDSLDVVSSTRRPRERMSMARGLLRYRDCQDFRRKGDIDRSLAACQEAAGLLTAIDHPLGLKAGLEAALDLADAGRLASVKGILDDVARRARDRGYPSLEGPSRWEMGLLQLQKQNYAVALDDFKAARRILETAKEHDHTARLDGLFGNSYFCLGNHREAWRTVRGLLRFIDYLDAEHRHNYLVSPAIYFRDSMPNVALAFLREARDRGDSGVSPVSVVEGDLVTALAENRQGHDREAQRLLSRAEALIPSVASPALSRILRGEFLTYSGEAEATTDAARARESLKAAIDFARKSEQTDLLPQIFLALGRANVGLRDTGEAKASFESGIDEFERFRRSQGEARVSYFDGSWDLFSEIIRLEVQEKSDPVSGLDYAERARGRDLLDAGGLLREPRARPLGALEIAARLPRRVALIYYCVLDDSLFEWVVREGQVRFVRVPVTSERLTTLSGRYRRRLLEAGVSRLPRETISRDLHDVLIRPLLPYVSSGDSLVFLPDGILHSIPFAALEDSRTHRYLVEDHAVSIAPSGTVFLRACQRGRAFSKERELAALFVGGARVDPESAADLPGLPQSVREVEEASANYRHATILAGEEATPSRFREAGRRSAIIHFAGHAIADADYPDLSRLVMARGRDGSPGDLFAREIYGIELPRTRLVVLSACGAANGPISRGEGPMSLARPFLAAGVPDVVASLWRADDGASRRLLVEFHRGIGRGESPAESLREAQLALLKDGDPALSRPGAWAGFQVLGAVFEPLPKDENGGHPWQRHSKSSSPV